MAINVTIPYHIDATIIYHDDKEVTFRNVEHGSMDEVKEKVIAMLIKHNFTYAEAVDSINHRVFMTIERT